MPDSAPTAQVDRKQQILMALAEMLEEAPDTRITTARLASAVGVSEAALYRHFPSKRNMYAALLEFAEDTLFGLIGRIPGEQAGALDQCHRLLCIYLEFCEKNPGITRLLTGRALTGESLRLHQQVEQLYQRLETQLKQYLREAEIREQLRTRLPVATAANLLMAAAEGRVSQFCRSDFRRSPLEGWVDQWAHLSVGLMKPAVTGSP
ncbi:MAG: nucleoid occlusion factor SlmA [Luminiphilus sp.]|nr:nucleoid occlusion factor SlmA [Luminiphilus sp.]